MMPAEHIRFAPDVLSRLGEELVPHPEQGLVELVRNSYDADAITCSIEVAGGTDEHGWLNVSDDGDGMDVEALREGFLVVGRSQKAGRPFTRLGRRPVGDKGLGRLAALRLGRTVSVVTRPRSEPGVQYSLTLNWREFDAAAVVEAVPIVIDRARSDSPPGTRIEIRGLTTRLGRVQMRRLARALVLLADPFAENPTGFRPRLIAPEYDDLARQVESSYLADAEYRLVGTVNETGQADAIVYDANGHSLFTTRLGGQRGYRLPPTTFELWSFLRGPGGFAGRRAPLGAIREWLDVMGGVHVYYRGLRVFPYGEPGHDWLDMNLQRARSPEERPSTNNSVGRVVVDDPAGVFVQKTDRSGFVENDRYSELRRFCVDALDWMATERLRIAERRRRDDRERATRERLTAQRRVTKVIDAIPPAVRPQFAAAYDRLERAREREAASLRQDLLLYRTLGTLGTSVALFMHEAPRNVEQILEMSATISRRLTKSGDEVEGQLRRPLAVIRASAQALLAYANLPRRLLEESRRRVRVLDLNAAVVEVADMFAATMTATHVRLRLVLADEPSLIRGTPSAIDSILANLITNSVNAFIGSRQSNRDRTIEIQTSVGTRVIALSVLDNGPGIREPNLEDIWLPGRTLTEHGTGLGLTIVRDSVRDLGGSVQVGRIGRLGGAEFVIQLPRVDGNR